MAVVGGVASWQSRSPSSRFASAFHSCMGYTRGIGNLLTTCLVSCTCCQHYTTAACSCRISCSAGWLQCMIAESTAVFPFADTRCNPLQRNMPHLLLNDATAATTGTVFAAGLRRGATLLPGPLSEHGRRYERGLHSVPRQLIPCSDAGPADATATQRRAIMHGASIARQFDVTKHITSFYRRCDFSQFKHAPSCEPQQPRRRRQRRWR